VFRARLMVAAAAVAAAAVSAAGGAAARSSCIVPGTDRTIDQVWHPDMTAAIAYAHQRTGDIAFAVRTDHGFYGYRPDHIEWSASVVKAMLMVAYLDRASVANRNLNGYDRSLLIPMITQSDNNAATTVDGIVGNAVPLQAIQRSVDQSIDHECVEASGDDSESAGRRRQRALDGISHI